MTKILDTEGFHDLFDLQLNKNGLFQHTFANEIIRKYDIRGIVNNNLFEIDAYAIGLAFSQHINVSDTKTVTVGYDGRHSSCLLESALIKGLLAGGALVTRIGLVPTPMLYYSVHHLSADAGIIVTGSHNAPDYNGFKFMLKDRPFYGADLQELAFNAADGLYPNKQGRVKTADIKTSYLGRLNRTYHGKKPLSVVWDPGNGAAGEIVQELASTLPGCHCVINGDIDGDFPNHHPDPTVPSNLEQLKQAVIEGKHDLGIAFDGDGDRIGVVDRNGQIIAADRILTLFSKDILTRNPEATFIADVKTSQTFFDTINKRGGNAIMWNTGHSLIKTKMIETNALLAGEMSGHIFFADSYYGFDDALYAAVRLISLIAESSLSFEEMCASLPAAHATPEIRIPCPENQKQNIMENILNLASSSIDDICTIDGIRISNEHGWWLIRPSNTEPVLVARCEAWSPNSLLKLTNTVKELIEQQGLQFNTTS